MEPLTIGFLVFMGANGMVGLGYKLYKKHKKSSKQNNDVSDMHRTLINNPSPEEISQNPFED